jgi:Ca2+-binding RTX toxin-like protein
LKTRPNGDTFRFLAAQDGTEVSIDGAVVATLNRGELHQQLVTGYSRVTSNKPILVAQYSNGGSFDGTISDPFMMLIPPTEQFGDQYTVTTPASGFRSNFINLVVPDPDVGTVAIDGTPVPSGDYTPIGSSGFSGSQNDVALGTHNLTGDRPFGAYMYGFDQDDSYGYPGGQSFAPIASVASMTLTPAAATHTVGTTQCVDAKLFDANGAPVPDVRVDFSVSGANPLAADSINADAGGNAQLCYPGANLGEDSITATQGRLSATATKTWAEPIPAPPPAPPLAEGCGLNIDGVDLLGDNAKNALTGTARTDRLRGSGEADVLAGAASADCLRGDEGRDDIGGDDGADIIRGGADADDIDGGAGNDNIRAQNGDDKVDGGSGDDFIKAQARGTDKVTCGTGNDRVIGDRKDKIADDCEKVKIVNPN